MERVRRIPWTSTYWFASMPSPNRPPRARALALGAARLDALGLAALLGEMRRPGGVAQAPLLVAPGQIEQLIERRGVLVDIRRGVALLPHPRRDGVEPQFGRIDVGHLFPLERAADPGVGHRPDRVARGDGPVPGVLVVVDEDTVPLLLPPFAGGIPWQPPLHLARERERGPAHLDVVPARLDADVDVNAPRPGRL